MQQNDGRIPIYIYIAILPHTYKFVLMKEADINSRYYVFIKISLVTKLVQLRIYKLVLVKSQFLKCVLFVAVRVSDL